LKHAAIIVVFTLNFSLDRFAAKFLKAVGGQGYGTARRSVVSATATTTTTTSTTAAATFTGSFPVPGFSQSLFGLF